MDDFVDEIAKRFDAYEKRREEIQNALTESLTDVQQKLNRPVSLDLVDANELVWQIEIPGIHTVVSSTEIDDCQRFTDGFGNPTSERDKDVKTAVKEILLRKLRFTS